MSSAWRSVNSVRNPPTLSNLDIVTAAGIVESQCGPIIVIINQYAYLGRDKTIHSSAQLEHYHNRVQDCSRTVGGNQCIVTLDDYIIPFNIRQGLPYMSMRTPTNHEFNSLPHVVLTLDVNWDPSVLDNKVNINREWHSAIHDLPDAAYIDPHFDNMGQYLHWHIATCDLHCHDALDCALDCILTCNKHNVQHNELNYEAICPCWAWVSSDTVCKTILATTQHAREFYNAPLCKHFKSGFAASNVHHRNEAVATDTIWSNTPAIYNGAKCAERFVGQCSLVTIVYPIKTDKELMCVTKVLWINLSVTVPKPKSVRRSSISLVPTTLTNGRVNQITSIRTLLNVALLPLKPIQTMS